MRDRVQKDWAVRHARMVLIKAGLSDGEADSFLESLRDEFMGNLLTSKAENLRFYQQQIHELTGKKLSPEARARIEGLILGVAGNALWELLKFGYEEVRTYTLPASVRKSLPGMWRERKIPMDQIEVHWICNEKVLEAGDSSAGDRLIRRSLEVMAEVFGPHHPNTVHARTSLGINLDLHGRHTDAEPVLHRVASIAIESFGVEHRYFGAALSNLGVNLERQRRHSDAERILRRSLEIMEGVLGPKHYDTGGVLANLGVNLLSQERYAEAEPLLSRAAVITSENLNPDDPRIKAITAYLATARAKNSETRPSVEST